MMVQYSGDRPATVGEARSLPLLYETECAIAWYQVPMIAQPEVGEDIILPPGWLTECFVEWHFCPKLYEFAQPSTVFILYTAREAVSLPYSGR